MAFADGFEMVYTIKYDLQAITNLKIQASMMTDTLLILDILTKSSVITEPHDWLKTVKCADKNMELQDVAFIQSAFNMLAGW